MRSFSILIKLPHRLILNCGAGLTSQQPHNFCQKNTFCSFKTFNKNGGTLLPQSQFPSQRTFEKNQRAMYSSDNDNNNNDNNNNNNNDQNTGEGYDEDLQQSFDIQMHETLLQRYHLASLTTQNVMVIQPFARKGEIDRMSNTDRDLMMMETLGLVETLEWNVVHKMFLGIEGLRKATFFGSGQIDSIKEIIESLEIPNKDSKEGPLNDAANKRVGVNVSAIFVSTYRLSGRQRALMEEELGKPVLDRYNIVLQIFKRHARTREAQLQVKLAEIPYLRARLLGDYEMELLSKNDKGRKGSPYFDNQRAILGRRESKIKEEIVEMASQRKLLRKNRNRYHIPSIAVVGYTNCGKTSLIKAITGTTKLIPKNKLFATLDVTVHPAKLPTNLTVLFVDTVGFITDVPASLITSFESTLEDVSLADLIIHVRDVSHPDHVAQNDTVIATLSQLNVPKKLTESCITVGNKIDLINPSDWQAVKDDGMLPISTLKGYGLPQLIKQIEKQLIASTDRKRVILRVKTGSPEFKWLMQNATIYDVARDDRDDNYCQLHGLLLDLELNQFKKFVSKNS